MNWEEALHWGLRVAAPYAVFAYVAFKAWDFLGGLF